MLEGCGNGQRGGRFHHQSAPCERPHGIQDLRVQHKRICFTAADEATVAELSQALIEAAPGITCPWLGIFGESADGVPDPEIGKLREAAASSAAIMSRIDMPSTSSKSSKPNISR